MPNADDSAGELPVIGSPEDERTLTPAEEAVAQAVRPAVEDGGAVLEDVIVRDAGPHRSVQILVERAESTGMALDLDALAEISQPVSAALDVSDVMGEEPYELEVSTPGASRPLTRRRHLERNIGRWLTVKRHGAESVKGRLLEVGEDSLTLQGELPAKKGVKPKPADPVVLPFTDISQARVDVELSARDARTEAEEA